MVKLSLLSPKGNQGVRYFPHQGYLGLTPLRFEGLVRTQIEQDGKPILAKDLSVAIRCYESRQGRLGSPQTNVLYEHSLSLWQKHDALEWSELGDSEYPFRLTLPAHIAAPSTALLSQEYRIFWRIEAVLNHAPISGVGSRQVKHFDLLLTRYDVPSSLSPPTPLSPSSPSHMILLKSKSLRSSLRYHVLTPSNPIGPLDIVTIQLTVQPLDSSISVRSASAFVERRMHFNDFRLGPPEPPPGPYRFSSHLPPTPQSSCNHIQDCASSFPESNASSSQDLTYPASSLSLNSGDSSRPLLQRCESNVEDITPLPFVTRTTTHIIAHAESVGRFSKDPSGAWSHNLTFSWPDTKSSSRWAAGESVQTGMVDVKFFLRVKLVVSSLPNSAETVELEDKELCIVSVNDMQRRLAFSTHSDSDRSKSKSPKCFRRERHTEQLPSPPRSPRETVVPEDPNTSDTKSSFPAAHFHNISTASSPYPEGTSIKPEVLRRPYTSPRSRPDRGMYENCRNRSSRLVVPPRPETAHPMHFPKCPTSSRSFLHQKSVESPRLGSSSSTSSSGHLTVESLQHHASEGLLFQKANQVEVQAWEQELARIESASRRNSAVILRKFWSRRKKASVEHSSIPMYLHAEG